MDDHDSSFSTRLNEVFLYRDITSTRERIARLTSVTGRSRRTVRRWLSGDCVPRHDYAFLSIASDLDIDAGWLYDGRGWTPWQHDFAEKLALLPRAWVPKMMRYCLRLLNKDPKALRWAEMLERGELSAEQVLAMA